MDHHAIGLVEVNSIAKGFEVCDTMAKTANVSVLVAKLAISDYNRKAPLDETPYQATRVTLPLRQHVGAPALPCVAVGDTVSAGQLIAEIAPNALGARVHASIGGRVETVTEHAISIAA